MKAAVIHESGPPEKDTGGVMKLVSVNVSLPKTVDHEGRTVSTGIYNEPVAGRVMVRKLNVEGDGQADLTVHGGVDKAI